MKKDLLVPLLLAAFLSCGSTKKTWISKHEAETVEEIDTVDAYIDESGRVVWLVPHPLATFDPYANRWDGPDAERINRVWCGHIALDTLVPFEERKWKWTISEEEKSKMSQEDIRLGDSLIYFVNNE